MRFPWFNDAVPPFTTVERRYNTGEQKIDAEKNGYVIVTFEIGGRKKGNAQIVGTQGGSTRQAVDSAVKGRKTNIFSYFFDLFLYFCP